MERKKGKTALVVALAGAAALLIIVLCYYLINTPDDASNIALPDYTYIPTDQQEEPEETVFAAVTVDNVLQVLESLTPLEAYQSTISLEYYWSDGSALQTAQVWSRGTAQKLVLSGEGRSAAQHMLLREDGAWLWYEDEQTVTALPAEHPAVEDLLGIPDYRALSESGTILDADYATLAGTEQVNCIYIRWELTGTYTAACWVSLETGLLARAIIEENGSMVYRMQQTQVERLLPGDEAYQTPFLLPSEQP